MMQNITKKQKISPVFKLIAVLGCLGLLLAGSGWPLAPATAGITAAAQATVTPDNAPGCTHRSGGILRPLPGHGRDAALKV